MRSWKSLRLTSHTWLGLNPQIGRPLSRIVVPLVYFLLFSFCNFFAIPIRFLKSSGQKWRGQTPKEFNNIWYVASRDQYAIFKTPSYLKFALFKKNKSTLMRHTIGRNVCRITRAKNACSIYWMGLFQCLWKINEDYLRNLTCWKNIKNSQKMTYFVDQFYFIFYVFLIFFILC
jgi:hypothetical protein